MLAVWRTARRLLMSGSQRRVEIREILQVTVWGRASASICDQHAFITVIFKAIRKVVTQSSVCHSLICAVETKHASQLNQDSIWHTISHPDDSARLVSSVAISSATWPCRYGLVVSCRVWCASSKTMWGSDSNLLTRFPAHIRLIWYDEDLRLSAGKA